MEKTSIVGGPKETKAQIIARMEKAGFLDPNCKGCEERYTAPVPYAVFAPSHKPSDNCKSGKRPHCSCDTCF